MAEELINEDLVDVALEGFGRVIDAEIDTRLGDDQVTNPLNPRSNASTTGGYSSGVARPLKN